MTETEIRRSSSEPICCNLLLREFIGEANARPAKIGLIENDIRYACAMHADLCML